MQKGIYLLLLFLFVNNCFSQIIQRFASESPGAFVYSNGKVYIAHSNGLSVYDYNSSKQEFITMLNSLLPSNRINSLINYGEKEVLGSTPKGLFLIDSNGVIRTDVNICQDYSESDARNIIFDSLGNLWTHSSHSVSIYKDSKWKSIDVSKRLTANFDISNILAWNGNIWVTYYNNEKTPYTYYETDYASDYYFNFAVISDTGVIKILNKNSDFPTISGYWKFLPVGDTLWAMNGKSIYIYDGQNYKNTRIKCKNYEASEYGLMAKDKNGCIWFTGYNSLDETSCPLVYDPAKGIIRIEKINDTINEVYFVNTYPDGIIVANTMDNFYFKTDTGWITKTAFELGIPKNCYFGFPKWINKNSMWLTIYVKGTTECPVGTLIELGTNKRILPYSQNFRFKSVVNLAVGDDQKGIYKESERTESVGYDSDSGFTMPQMYYRDLYSATVASDGKVYFAGIYQPTDGPSIYVSTWLGNLLINYDIGYKDSSSSELVDFTIKDNKIYSIGYYFSGRQKTENYISTYYHNSFLTVFDKEKNSIIYQNNSNQSCLPDFYTTKNQVNLLLEQFDTIPISIIVDNSYKIWILTTNSLIKFDNNNSQVFSIPDIYSYQRLAKIYYNKESNEILFDSYFNRSGNIYYFSIDNAKWDSITYKNAGLISNLTKIKNSPDGRVWASDDSGYLYRYKGNGQFIIIPLNLPNGRPNLGFPINDFSIDNNNRVSFGTEIGLISFELRLEVKDQIVGEAECIVYPNPAHDFIYLMGENSITINNYSIIDITGKEVQKGFITDSKRIEIAKLQKGTYYLNLKNKIFKFIKD